VTSRTLAKHVAELMLSKKAHDIMILEVRKLTSAADFFVVCTADSDTQVKAIADAVEEGTMAKGERPWHSEGHQARTWILVDYVDVVAHVFHRDARSFYNLERLWRDAPRTDLTEAGDFVKEEARKKKASVKKSAAKPRSATPRRKKATL
jgi:ribosome-associated protein